MTGWVTGSPSASSCTRIAAPVQCAFTLQLGDGVATEDSISPFDGGCAEWRGPELTPADWLGSWTDSELAEIDTALRAVQKAGLSLDDMRRDDFKLERAADRLSNILDELEIGRGFRVMRGIPVARYTTDEARTIFWGLGLHLGTAVPQSRRNDFIGDVRNLNIGINTVHGRGYTSNEALSYHTDSCDVSTLLCLRTAKSGGRSLVASSIAVHNEMLARRPDLVEVLYRPMPFSRMGNEHATQPRWYQAPVFSLYEGKFCGQYTRVAANGVRFLDEAPQPTNDQIEAATMLETIAADPAIVFTFDLQPGDMQFMNSHLTFHNRTSFEDWPERERHRHLLRLWLSVPTSRPLAPSMAELYRDIRPGVVRGGYLTSDDLPRRFSTEAALQDG